MLPVRNPANCKRLMRVCSISAAEIANGYILQEVKTRSVVITRGSEKIEVELQMLLPPEARVETQPSATVPPPVVKPELPKKE